MIDLYFSPRFKYLKISNRKGRNKVAELRPENGTQVTSQIHYPKCMRFFFFWAQLACNFNLNEHYHRITCV